VAQAAASSGEIASNMAGVASAAAIANDVVGPMASSVADLSRMADDLDDRVGEFTY
jgi:methyl-accepting chemotaxis protein